MRSLAVACVACVLAIVGVIAASPPPQDKSPRSENPQLALTLRRTPPMIVTHEGARVEWQLENVGPAALYVCQWPGIAFSRHWECPNDVTMGTGPGYPDSRRLDRKYFVQLMPGEALIGYDHIQVWPTPSGEMTVRAEFRCDQDGSAYGLAGWKGEMVSDWVTVEVPKDPTGKSCEQK